LLENGFSDCSEVRFVLLPVFCLIFKELCFLSHHFSQATCL
jgi:hypothetical protein